MDLTNTGQRVDGLITPLGLGNPRPRLTWRLEAPDRYSVRQRAFQLRVFGERDQAPCWDSGRVDSGHSGVVYGGPPLASRQRYEWSVRVWDVGVEPSAWSKRAGWEMGLLEPDDWEADWIRAPEADTVPDVEGVTQEGPAPLFRHVVTLPAPVERARIYATALGLYELRLNGQRVGEQELAPGWTDYRRRVQYQTYDVTSLLRPGDNVIGAMLGNGWYCGNVAWFGRHVYGSHPALLLQLEVAAGDGTAQTVCSDTSWRTAPSELRLNDLLMGESQDAIAAPIGWDQPSFDDASWQTARVQAPPGAELVAQQDAGTGIVAVLRPAEVRWSAGKSIVDFGQNLAGRVRLDLELDAGTEVRLRHGEMLDEHGRVYTANLRTASQADSYISRGGAQTIRPRFTYHGFRFVEIEGPPIQLEREQVKAEVISARMERTGAFSCSDPMLQRLQENIVWGQRGNFVSIPTDCPQRDERLGWTADVQVFAPTAAFNTNVQPFLRKWLIDLEDAQHPSGAYPDIAPATHYSGAGNAGWADAGILVPWCLYLRYGDTDVLERHYGSMVRYVEYLRADSTDYIRSAGLFGDWLSLEGATPKDVVGTAFFAHSARLLSRIAGVLGDEERREEYAALFESVREVFIAHFVAADGAIAGRTQTAQILALGMDLIPDAARHRAAELLADSIAARGEHLVTGFLGTPMALPVLSDHGYHDLACRVAQQRSLPSWGYQVEQGATTVWERWDGWTPERGFQDEKMNSFNHYAFGSVGDWLYRYVGGLDPDEEQPGYAHARICPRPGGTISWAEVEHDSPRGRWRLRWDLDGDGLEVGVTVPANATAEVILPCDSNEIECRRGDSATHRGDNASQRADGSTVIYVGSGRFAFSARRSAVKRALRARDKGPL